MVRRRRWISDRPLLALFFIGFVLLILSGCGGFATSSSSSAPESNTCIGASNIVSCVAQSNLQIDVGNAPQMQVDDSQVVKVVLGSISGSSISNSPLSRASIPAEKATVTSTTTNPVGTPDAPLRFAFGPGYEPYAIATLSPNPAFTIMPLGDTAKEQSLNQSSILWRWSVIANEPGTEILDVNIEAKWKPTSKKFPELPSVGIGDVQISIQVAEPIPSPTPVPTSAPTPKPTLTTAPSPTSAQSISTTSDPLQIAANIFQLVGVIWVFLSGGKAVYDIQAVQALRSKTKVLLRWPKPSTVTNILLALILLVLLALFFHPTLLPLPHR